MLNEALLGKWLWRFGLEKDVLWPRKHLQGEVWLCLERLVLQHSV